MEALGRNGAPEDNTRFRGPTFSARPGSRVSIQAALLLSIDEGAAATGEVFGSLTTISESSDHNVWSANANARS